MQVFLPRPAASRRTAVLAALVALTGSFAGVLHAQEQESVAMNRMLHPDQTLKAVDADRKFSGGGAVAGKEATVHPFLFSHPASVKAGDGVFRTHGFNGSKVYAGRSFATKASPAATQDSYAQTSKLFAVKAMAVHEDRAAGKTMDTRVYDTSDRTYIMHGKRQDTIDELRKSQQMTIEQVRELLNKSR